MAFIEYYNKPLSLYGKTSGGLAAQLNANTPSLFPDDAPRGYIAFCLLDSNLEPLDEETIQPKDLAPERLPSKFAIAMRSSDFGWCRLSHCLVFVLSLPPVSEELRSDTVERYAGAAEDFLSMMEADFGINLSASVSELFVTLDACEGAVRDALTRVDFACFIEARVNVVDPFYYNGMKRFLSRKYPEYLLVNYERPIIAAVLNHNYLHAELVLGKFLIAHLCDPIHVFPTTHTTMVNICRVVLSLSTSNPKETTTQCPQLFEALEHMRLCSTLSEMQHHIHQFFLLIQDYIKTNDKYASISKKMQRIIDFIDDNYKNPMFDAAMVSDKFDITPSYLSRVFREEVGVNLSTYVQTVRISAAKDLLQRTEMTVDRIATEVGYIGGQNLLRLFKKYEGVSPTEYKALVRGAIDPKSMLEQE